MIRMLGISTVLFLLAGCNPGEGQRCNPLLVGTNDCNNGFLCTYKPNCGVAYCCPTMRVSTNPRSEEHTSELQSPC